ncbi:MAG: hypothetical protein JSV32_06400 [Dehalococcoidia bacterium]|nr:MAG: hypothetical protein JSV32_06400 [Dehalococcoidia bacterium]
MSERLMLIVPADLVAKIDANRGDLSQAEFIGYLIDRALNNKLDEKHAISKDEIDSIKSELKKLIVTEEQDIKKKYATKEEVQSYMQDNRKLLKNFLDFFIGYGLEMGKKSDNNELLEITSKLKGLEEELAAEDEGSEVKIKWK